MSFRQRLFGLTDSPADFEGNLIDIESIITPETKGDDSGIGMDTPSSFWGSVKTKTSSKKEVRRSLFSNKRPAESDLADDSPCMKKIRTLERDFAALTTQNVKQAVERLESRDLIADGSRDYLLPTIPGKHGDLKSITCKTMADVLAGRYHDEIGKVTIVDCRYPYEFEGGHIQGAVNMYTKDQVNELLHSNTLAEKPHILVFHCEFSSERGPKMYRFLRSQDRKMNKDHYPTLNFPEIYLLHNGYKEFYNSHKEHCDPISYKPMLHEDHTADLRHFRVKSKSWTDGEKQQSSTRHRSRLSRHISF